MKNSYMSLSVAIDDLKKNGYDVDYNLHEEGLQSKHHGKMYSANEMNVVKYYRFEGMTNPADSSILYVIETTDGNKGLLVDSYGAQSSSIPSDLLEKLKVDPMSFK